MKTFDTLEKFARHMQKVVKTYHYYEAKAAHFIGESLVKEAKDSIGHLQHGAGPFQAWPELAESTKADKERQGYVFNHEYNPLLRTGEMRDSIHYDFNPGNAFSKLRLGSDSQIMVYQELGTPYIPPRSVLGLTMIKATPMIHYALGSMVDSWIEGKGYRPRSVTYGSI